MLEKIKISTDEWFEKPSYQVSYNLDLTSISGLRGDYGGGGGC